MKRAFFPGCSLQATGREYGISTRAVARHLDLELIEIPDWNCCGASSAHSTDELLALALPARNLALAEKMGLDIVAPCAGCFNRLRAAEVALRKLAWQTRVEQLLGMPVTGKITTCNLLDFLVNQVGPETIRRKVIRPLRGLRVVCYYGCLLVRPRALTGFDDPENPQSMDRLMLDLGATVIDWPFKTECCGGNLAIPCTDLTLKMSGQLLRRAQEAGAEAIVTACPLCMLNLDARQEEMEKFGMNLPLPIFYFTELMGLSMGLAPESLGLQCHFTDPQKLLQAKLLL